NGRRDERRERREPPRVDAVHRYGDEGFLPRGEADGPPAAKLGKPALDFDLTWCAEQTRNYARVPVSHLLMFHAGTYDKINARTRAAIPFRRPVARWQCTRHSMRVACKNEPRL